jgi:hypothetical protein
MKISCQVEMRWGWSSAVLKTPLDIVCCNAPRSAGNLAESVPRSFETQLLPPREKTGFADGEKCTKNVPKTRMHFLGAI